jgi:transposase
MAPLQGWAPRGQRIKATVPHGHWQTMTFLAAFRNRITSPWLLDGPINGECFLLYLQEILGPALRPSDIVIMDSLVRTIAAPSAAPPAPRRRAALLRAKYSRYLNPIQQFFAKLKHWFRKAAARTTDAVCDAIGHIRATVTSAECTNYFAHAGYEQT